MRAARPQIAIPVLLLLGGSSCLLLLLVLASLLPGTGDSADGRSRTAGEAVRRAVCSPPGRDPGNEAAEFHEREVRPRAASATARGSPASPPRNCSPTGAWRSWV